MFDIKYGKTTADDTCIITNLKKKNLLENAKLNKGCAFTEQERKDFDLTGKLPFRIETLEEQAARHYQQYQVITSNLSKNIYLNALHDSNETLFYHLVSDHLTEMLPIVYTPTVGEAVEQFSHELRRTRGLYIAYPDRDNIESILDNRLNEHVDLIVVTDGEGVLGIGDQGIGGMDISIAKLMVYTLSAGINPNRVLPIQLDVGTNNQALLQDSMYLGWRNQRISGKDYDDFIDLFVTAVRKKFPNIYLHWEDFGRDNARKNLERYRHDMCTFNDDMQGTGATALACVLSGLIATKSDLCEQRIVFFGAGTAGVGIADQICMQMQHQGLDPETARKNFWLLDRPGLLVNGMPELAPFQQPYARDKAELADWVVQDPNHIGLIDVIKNVKPTILIGCSTVHGAFNEEVIKCMAEHVEHPIILPLSNPTSKSEAVPQDLLQWTNGKALIATGSPFEPVEYKGKTYRIAQSNNAFVFPGLGLGVIASKAARVSDGMISAACHALSLCSPAQHDKTAPILPDLTDVRVVSRKIALAVAKQALQEGIANIAANTDLDAHIEELQWEPKYYPYQYQE